MGITVCHEDGDYLAQGRMAKVRKYTPLLPLLQKRVGVADGEVLPIVVGTRGAMPKETVKALRKLRITDRSTLITIMNLWTTTPRLVNLFAYVRIGNLSAI